MVSIACFDKALLVLIKVYKSIFSHQMVGRVKKEADKVIYARSIELEYELEYN